MGRLVVRCVVGLLLLGACVGGAIAATTRSSPASAYVLPAGLPPVPSPSPSSRRAYTDVIDAGQSVISHDRSCGPQPPSRSSTGPARGAPSLQLERWFGVFGMPATDAPQRPEPTHIAGGALFRGRARIARRAGTTRFVVAPLQAPSGSLTGLYLPRCRRLVDQAIDAKVRDAGTRRRARRIWGRFIADDRYEAAHRNALICVLENHGGRTCGTFLRAVTSGLTVVGGGTHADASPWADLVPDGIASITVHYVTQSLAQALRHRTPRPAGTVTAKVVNNLAVWRLPAEPGRLVPHLIQWRSATGQVVRTIYP